MLVSRQWTYWLVPVVLLLALTGTWAAWDLVFPSPLKRARVAYEHNNWREASRQARHELDQRPNSTEALRLLARASSRLEDDQTAQALYGRLGSDHLRGEDYLLIARTLLHQREPNRALVLLRKAYEDQPGNPEISFELTRLLARSDQLLEALPLASRLARTSQWEQQGLFVLGILLRELKDHSGAAGSLLEELRRNPTLQGLPSSAPEVRILIIRTLLEAGNTSKARQQLQYLSLDGSDPEASWLLSRAWIQENNRGKAIDALERSHNYSDTHIMTAEPTQFVGSLACAGCHPANYRSQQRSRHAKTFHNTEQLANLAIPEKPTPDPITPQVLHRFKKNDDSVQVSTQVGNSLLSAIIDYAFGSGDRGLTLVGHEANGQSRELRLSRYERGSLWDQTSGQIPSPDDPHEYLGRPLSADGVRRCILCHTTSGVVDKKPDHPESADHAIGCERCHGPGGNHLIALKLELPDMAIGRPKLASASQITTLCGQCHSPRGSDVDPAEPSSVRFQATTLTWSHCYTRSEGALSCTNCHSPHHDAVTDASAYEPICLSCHSTQRLDSATTPIAGTRLTKLPEGVVRTPCPVDPRSGCVECHMPIVTNAIPHSPFTDHHIRIHKRTDRAQ